MEHSESIKNIATALLAFQKDAPAVTKDAKANYGKYATLGNVIDSTRDDLAKNGLSFMQMPDGDSLTTLIMHTSGEWVRATGKLILDKQTAQGLGSALTYGRRYGLTAALGIAADEDDDGAAAERSVKPAAKPLLVARQEIVPNKVEGAAPAWKRPIKSAEQTLKEKKADIAAFLNAHPTVLTPLKDKEDFEEACLRITGIALKDENADAILKFLTK